MFKTTLNLDALEAREVPAVIGWAKVEPPPPVVGQASIVKVEPTPPAFVGLGDKVKVEPTPPVAGKAGILLPALNKVEPPPPAPNGILFPVFVGR